MSEDSMDHTHIVEAVGITKDFPGVKALSDFNFGLRRREVHCLVGENGAGKSTFIKILSGVIGPSGGHIVINGGRFDYLSTHLVRSLGIQTVYQEDLLVPEISAAENIFLGSKFHRRKLFFNHNEIIKKSEALAELYGINLNIKKLYGDLNPADQQFTKLLKTLAQDPAVLILDEPTQVFTAEDRKLVITIVRRITEKGVSVIYIAHDLDEVIEVADRITVLRDGTHINTHDMKIEKIDSAILAKEMVGRPVNLFYRKKIGTIGDVVFEVKNLRLKPESKPINFDVREGEVVGIAGLKGSGRSEIARAIFGAHAKIEGSVFYRGRDITPRNPREAVRNGVALLTEDKKIDGLYMGMPVCQNITIVGLNSLGRFFLNLKKEKDRAGAFMNRLRVKAASVDQEVRYLSGGNQQKIVIAKWLFKGVNVLIVDEPTHGIDVNAKAEVYELFTELTAEGKSIIMISSEMPEIISLSDRVVVIKDFEISSILAGKNISEENILSGYLGGGRQ